MPLPSGVQTEQILKAVKALLKHIEKQNAKANSLIEEDELIYLVRVCCWLQTSEAPKRSHHTDSLLLAAAASLPEEDAAADKEGQALADVSSRPHRCFCSPFLETMLLMRETS